MWVHNRVVSWESPPLQPSLRLLHRVNDAPPREGSQPTVASTVDPPVTITLKLSPFTRECTISGCGLSTALNNVSNMLTLKYQGKQRGPQYFFQIESSVNFLSKDLVIIAYNSSGFQENFSNINEQSLNALKYVVGTIFTSYSQSGYTMMAASFSNAEVILSISHI